MAVAPSFQDILTLGVNEAQARRGVLEFRDGDVSLALMHGGAAMADAVIRFTAQSTKESYLDGAEGEVLTALVDDRYNIQRDAASFAQVTVEFSRTSGGAAGSIPEGTKVATTFDVEGNSVEFLTDDPVSIAAGDNGPFSVMAQAAVSGVNGNVLAGTVSRIEDSLFDSFTVTNPLDAGGGNDSQVDPDLREEAREFFLTLRRGTSAALEFGAKQVATVANARTLENSSTGAVTVFVSDQDGSSTAQMVADVQSELENWRCAGSTINVTGGNRFLVDLNIQLVVRRGFDVSSRAQEFVDAISTRMNRQRVGETMFRDTLVGACYAVAPDDVFDVIFNVIFAGGVVQPDADIVPSLVQVIRPGVITVEAAP